MNVVTESKQANINIEQVSMPDDWTEISLGKLLKLKSGLGLSAKNMIKGNIPVYGGNGISGFHNEYTHQESVLVIGRVGAKCGCVHMTESFSWITDNALFVSKYYLRTNRLYVYYLLKQLDLNRYANKNAQPVISGSKIYPIKVGLPPISEQQNIANILNLWDTAIEKTQQLIEQLEIRKRGLMQQLLSGKKRLAGFDEEWIETRIGDFFSERKETGLIDLPLLSVGIEGVYPQELSDKKDTSNSDKSKYKRICVGDIGYNTMRMWQGRSALSSLEGIVSPAYTVITPNENADSKFFSYLFKMPAMVHKFYRNSQGMVSDTLMCKFKDLSIVKIYVPPTRAEQEAISLILDKQEKEIEVYHVTKRALQEQKKGLMQQLLKGKIRVK